MLVKKSVVYTILLLILLVGAGFLFLKPEDGKGNTNYDSDEYSAFINGEIQEITLSMKDYNYYPQTIKVKAGSPVRISLDSSVYGCFRAFTIPAFGIYKNLKTPGDYIEFTPGKKGTYRFSCTMGMGTGTLIVE